MKIIRQFLEQFTRHNDLLERQIQNQEKQTRLIVEDMAYQRERDAKAAADYGA